MYIAQLAYPVVFYVSNTTHNEKHFSFIVDLILCTPGIATTYYFSPTGNDITNSGTSMASPWQGEPVVQLPEFSFTPIEQTLTWNMLE